MAFSMDPNLSVPLSKVGHAHRFSFIHKQFGYFAHLIMHGKHSKKSRYAVKKRSSVLAQCVIFFVKVYEVFPFEPRVANPYC